MKLMLATVEENHVSRFSSTQRNMARLLITMMVLIGFTHSTAQAAFVSTGQIVDQQLLSHDRQQLISRLSEPQAVETMTRMGVDPAVVQSRVDSMTAEELTAFNQQVEDMQAGGSSVVGVVILVFVVLVVLDLLGTTNIFPAIKPINTD